MLVGSFVLGLVFWIVPAGMQWDLVGCGQTAGQGLASWMPMILIICRVIGKKRD